MDAERGRLVAVEKKLRKECLDLTERRRVLGDKVLPKAEVTKLEAANRKETEAVVKKAAMAELLPRAWP